MAKISRFWELLMMWFLCEQPLIIAVSCLMPIPWWWSCMKSTVAPLNNLPPLKVVHALLTATRTKSKFPQKPNVWPVNWSLAYGLVWDVGRLYLYCAKVQIDDYLRISKVTNSAPGCTWAHVIPWQLGAVSLPQRSLAKSCRCSATRALRADSVKTFTTGAE